MLNLKRYLVRTRIRQESIAGTAMANLLLIFFAVVSIIPMLWLLLAPSKTDAEITDRNPLAFGSIEGYRVAWENLQSFNDGVVKSWAWNSLWYTAAIVVIATTSATLAGFVLAASKVSYTDIPIALAI